MRFLIDAQLPPALADRLCECGHEADHVNLIGLGDATDRRIFAEAILRRAVLMTKDADFTELATERRQRPPIIWIRVGNTTNAALWAVLEPLIDEIVKGLEGGETLIEVG